MKCYKNILLVMDGDLCNMLALKQVVALAQKDHGNLTLLTVIESLPKAARMLVTAATPYEIKNKIIKERLAELEALVSMIGQGDTILRTRARYGNPEREIAREAAENGYDLLIDITRKGAKYHRSLINHRLLRNSDCQIMFLKPEEYRTPDRFQASLNARHSMKQGNIAGDIRLRTGSQSFAG